MSLDDEQAAERVARDEQAAERVARVETLLERVESATDPAARESAIELIRALLDLYGEGLNRVIATATRAGAQALDVQLAADELVAHLLLLHGLHPVDLPTRVNRAVQRVRDRLGGATPELIGVDGGVARLLVRGGCGCQAPTAGVRTALEEAIRDAAPEIERVQIDEAPPPPTLVPLDRLRGRIVETGPGAAGASG